MRRYGTRVRAVIERQIGDHHLAMDLAQDVWIRVHGALPRFKPAHQGGRFRPWIFAIACNRVRDILRKKPLATEPSGDEILERSPASERYDPSGRVEEQAAIDEALQKIPEPFGAALHLVDVLGLSYPEAAEALECSIGTVKSRVNRGRLTFRDHYLKSTNPRPAKSRCESTNEDAS